MSNSISPYSRSDMADQFRADKAEKEAVQTEHELEMDKLKKSYVAEKEATRDRFESSIQAERNSEYDQIRKARTEVNREARRLDSMKKEVVGQKTEELRKEALQADTEGREQLHDILYRNQAAQEYERNRGIEAENLVKNSHQKSAQQIMNSSTQQLNQLAQSKTTELEHAKADHATALDQIHNHYENLRGQEVQKYDTELNSIRTATGNELNEKKLVNSQWISNYTDRLRDPFYRLNRFESSIEDTGNAYVLRVKVPEYDRAHFKVQLSGQEVQIVGIRSNNDKAEVEPGRVITTNSFQNVSERFSLDQPVDGRAMTLQERGDWLIYHLPKFGAAHPMRGALEDSRISQAEAASIKEMDFPNSLPKPTIPKDTSGRGPLG